VLAVSLEDLEVTVEALTLKGTKIWKLKLGTLEDFRSWVGCVRRALRPEWVKTSVICAACANPFGTFRRKHHCRKCGQTLCAAHSKHRIKIEEYGYDIPVRVCDACYTRHNPESSFLGSSSPKMTRFRPDSIIGELKKQNSTVPRRSRDD
jgi:hypothetical protein